MKEYILKKRIFAVVFILAIFSFSVLNFINSYESLKEEITSSKEVISVSELETAINEHLYGRMNFVEAYGFIQVLLDKREINNFSYIQDEEGFLHYSAFYQNDDPEIFEYALRMKRLQDYVEPKGTKVLFVVPPGKYIPEHTTFRTGLFVNDPNPCVDELLFYLNRLGVETLDLRECLPNEYLSYEETFFKTDHHWTIPAAFYATGEVVDKIAEAFGENLDPEGYYTNINNYELVTYKSGMLGSMGRKTGATYSGLEDFTAIWPKYEGNFYREYIAREDDGYVKREGNFVKALMNTNLLLNHTDVYSDSQYSLYLNGILNYEKIVNQDNPNGVRFLMIRDSYFSPVIAFMAPMCGEINAIWSLETSSQIDIETCVKEGNYDYIVMEVYPYNINDAAFNFFKGQDK